MQIRSREIGDLLFQNNINIIKRRLRNAPEFIHNFFASVADNTLFGCTGTEPLSSTQPAFFPLQNCFNLETQDALVFLRRSVQSFVFFWTQSVVLGFPCSTLLTNHLSLVAYKAHHKNVELNN
ncbi:hypothetical protein P618_200752 [Holospora obtusa F1]|uniref:Uncharacterized protein n=1 Tax=Holospora obtusa F1 TaxID=1399147 RepID=W6TGM9_HOLOB|nr:hypothetical protein [Holospora obtusa]ETZ07070.1 hypothetical protein P618_200752 [Holospora obtusa F1]